MRLIKDNKQYNPNTINLIFSLIVSLIFTLIVVITSSRISTKLINQSRAEFDDYCEDMSSGYAQSVTLKIESYFSVLDTFIKTGYALNHTDSEVQRNLNKSKVLNHSDFMNVSFVNPEGIGFRQNMTLSDVTDREYFHKIVDNTHNHFLLNNL